MNPSDDANYVPGSPPPLPPGMPKYPQPTEPQPDPLEGMYEPWTRKPLYYWPILLQGDFVGYIWTSQNHDSAGLVRRLNRDDFMWMSTWPSRQTDTLAALYELVNPGGPRPSNPLVQDGMYPDGTPVDRSQGWGPLVGAPSPIHPAQFASHIGQMDDTAGLQLHSRLSPRRSADTAAT
ncbi:hypothetical protein NONO_c10000 [Nocardia nova SH22a]|uniref:Uncharacterized protein n=1 Tax=Nocardia nova SH22a TaxID=1415166 RepID=W5T9A3_9NOCA|nr:hypothetical protein NONO_c10000 [Nocardia nova SH22a]